LVKLTLPLMSVVPVVPVGVPLALSSCTVTPDRFGSPATCDASALLSV
jgi:hypothetical protein